MFSPILGHADYSLVRPDSPEHITGDPETVTLDHGIQQQPSATSHNEVPALTPAAWGTGWQCPAMMVGFMICGALLAHGHHLYYTTLDCTRLTSIEQQTWATRIGTGLAFLSRAFLVAASYGVLVVGSLTPREDLDGAGNLLVVPMLIPITAVITPAAISVDLLIMSNRTFMPVPTVDFAANTTWDSWSTHFGAGLIEAPSSEISRLFDSYVYTAFANWNREDEQLSLYTSYSKLSGANAGFYVLHLLFGDMLHRQLRTGASGSFSEMLPDHSRPGMSITQTGLFACPDLWNSSAYETAQVTTGDTTSYCNKTLTRAIEDVSHNFTYSNFYSYNQRNLLAAYITSVGVTAACVAVGFLAMHRNGVSQDTLFSTVLLTTRNPELDDLAIGHCLGSDKISDAIGEVKLRFGQIEGDREY
ncbi:hypothetical protein BJX68DRAFT_270877 [Aspergillus pseudodeflectus]|uniref:Uncharacterized protein n=1 Tax=Aspergillus pseudodeflectus TaxID=176178 RepID=A0ABR4JPG8_9EURO